MMQARYAVSIKNCGILSHSMVKTNYAIISRTKIKQNFAHAIRTNSDVFQ